MWVLLNSTDAHVSAKLQQHICCHVGTVECEWMKNVPAFCGCFLCAEQVARQMQLQPMHPGCYSMQQQAPQSQSQRSSPASAQPHQAAVHKAAMERRMEQQALMPHKRLSTSAAV
jgi:hypothetical protein